jgi:protein ImuB
MEWACIGLPQLALDKRQREMENPAQPLALLTGPIQRRVLHAVNVAAQGFGLSMGMPLASAQALCPQVQLHPFDPVTTEQLRQRIAAWAYRFSAQVSTDFSEAVVLEIGRSRRLFGEWPELQARLRDELQAWGITHRLCAAPYPTAAHVLAMAGDEFDGWGVDASRLQAALGCLPVHRAGLDAASVLSLQRLGLRQLRQVFDLPRDGLARRTSPQVLLQLDRMRGLLPTPVRYYHPLEQFDARIEFDAEVESHLALAFPLRRLIDDLALFLSARDGGAQQLSLYLDHEGRPQTHVEVGLLSPERDSARLFELARTRLERAECPAPVRGLRLRVTHLPPFVPGTHDLFDNRSQQTLTWPQLRERLRARLGDASVQGVGLRAEHRPELATLPHVTSKVVAPPEQARPAWLLSAPIPLRERVVQIVSGPERIESGWWDGADVRRDYYRVETAAGQQAWVFCAPGERGPYMLHGWFA